jgi:hypothetical protein
LPYPRELLACPTCEATEQTDDDTLTGSGRYTSHAWNVQLMVESLERALRLARIEDAERIVQRAIDQVDELLVKEGTIDGKVLAGLAVQAVATTLASGDPAWARWVMDVYGRAPRIPPVDVIDRLAEVAAQLPEHRGTLRESVNDLFRHIEHGSLPAAASRGSTNGDAGERAEPSAPPFEQDTEALGRLEDLRRSLEAGDGATSGAAPGSGARHLPTA